MKKVSIIVPVYNVEKYIRKCIESLINQTYSNIEIIFVNDGSPDNSQKIIDEFCKIDNRIISIVKKNEGVSTARNAGLEKATGEYIIFVDSDDYLELDYTEYFVNMIEKDNSDMAISFGLYDDVNSMRNISDDYKIIDGKIATEMLYLGRTGVAVWNKIYRRKIMEENKIKFNPEFWFAEGMTFNIEYFQKCAKIATGNKKVYHQTYNPESAVRKFNIESWYCGMRAMQYQKNILEENDSNIINAWNYHYRQYYYSILKGIYMSNSVDQYSSEKKNCVKCLRKNISYPLKANISKKDKIKSIFVALFPVLMAKRDIKKELKAKKTI